MVAYSRAKMSMFVLGVLKMVDKECQTAMLIHDMSISRLMVHAQQIEEEKLKESSRREKKKRSTMVISLIHGQTEKIIQDFDQRIPVKVPPKFNQDKVSNPKRQGCNGSGSLFPTSNCSKCGRKHDDKWLTRLDGCHSFCKSG